MFTRILTHIARLVALLTCLQSTLQVFAQGGLPGRHVDTIVSIQNEQKRLALTVATAELIEKVNNAISMVEPGQEGRGHERQHGGDVHQQKQPLAYHGGDEERARK